MKLKQISIFIENAPGRLFEVTNALGNAGINIRASNLVDTGDWGVLRLLVSDVDTTLQLMMEKHMPARNIVCIGTSGATPAMTYTFIPIGGVIIAISAALTTSIPNHIG